MTDAVTFGPRLAAHPTGALRSALLVKPGKSIELARPLPGEPNAFYTRAIAQQEILAKTLRQFGCATKLLEPHSDDPYAAAAVDSAIVFENGVVMMRPSPMTRRSETAKLEAEFERIDVPIAGHITPPGLLDGSDVLMAGATAFIGVSQRSNALGRGGFAAIAKAHGFTVVEVALDAAAPSLRAVAGAISADTLVIAPNRVDTAAFAGFHLYHAPKGHELGAGVLNVGDGHVIADVRFPQVVDALRKGGVTVEAIDLYDFGRIGLTPSQLVVDLKRA